MLHNKERYVWLLVLCLYAGVQVKAQYNTASFDNLSVEDGLSQSEVRSIYQDSRGFMWFGTADGLNKYDGYSFQHYKHNPFDTTSLSNNEVITIYEDHDANLWVGTADGLNRLDRVSGRFIRYTSLLSPASEGSSRMNSQYITAILEDKWRTLWVATWGGLKRLIPVKSNSEPIRYTVRHYEYNSANPRSLTYSAVLSLHEDRTGTLWVGTRDGLNRIRVDNPHAKPLQQKVWFENARNNQNPIFHTPHSAVRQIVEDKFGCLWLGTNRGLTRIHPGKQTVREISCQHSKPNGATDDLTAALLMDKQSELWIATQTNGICRFTIEDAESVAKMVHFKEEPFSGKGLKSNLIYSLYESKDPNEDIVWIGTRGAGVHKYSRAKNTFTLWSRLTNLDQSSGLNATFAIATGRHGLLWIGTVKGLVSIDRNDLTVKHYQHSAKDPGSLSNDFVCSVYEDRKGNLWIGTIDGLNMLNRQTGKFKRYYFGEYEQSRKNGENNIKVMYEDRYGVFWIGTMYDLKQFDPATGGAISYHHHPDDPTSLHQYYITSIQEDKEGTLWVGTRYGLNRFDRQTGRFTHYQHEYNNPTSLISSSVWNILKDHQGSLWICTNKGMNKMTVTKGEPQFVHYTEKMGLSNNFVYGAVEDTQGYIWMSTNFGLSRLDPQTGRFKNFDAGDGLPNNEFNEGAFHRSQDGELFFGGNSGVVSFRPAIMRKNKHLPSVAISAFKLFERPLNIDSIVATTGKVRLRYWENFFSFEFVALDFTNPRKNQYAYQLEGVNDEWVPAGNRHYANYTNLAPGEYTFRVKGSNSDGVWNENEEAAISVIIAPPFWRTWWFYVAVAVLLAVIINFLYDYRVKANVTRLMELERVKLAENERVRKLAAEDLHDEFGNRLTRISLLTDLIKARLNGHGAEVEELLSKIRDNSNQLYQGTKDFIWSINPQNDSVFEVAVRLKDFGDDIFDKTAVVFRTDGITHELSSVLLPMGQSRHLILLFKEAMSNVLKHSQADQVSLQFKMANRQLVIQLADDGKGFSKEGEKAGNGLLNMHSRTRKLSGQLIIQSDIGKGTTITLLLIIKRVESFPISR